MLVITGYLILKLAFEEDMSSLQISKLNDKRIVGYGNRAKGKQLSNVQISRIINSYNLILEKRKKEPRHYEQRKDFMNKKRSGQLIRKEQCEICGNSDNLVLHHIVPIMFGGENDENNLMTLCKLCHYKVHNQVLEKKGR